MTTFQIPEGKVVDRIELEAGESTATINIIYKEDKPEEKKRVAVLIATNRPTDIYLSNLTGELVVCGRADKPDPKYYVPMEKAEAGAFVVLPKNDVMAKLTALAVVLWQLSDSVPLKAMTQEQQQLNKQLGDCFTALSELIHYSGSK